MGNDLSVSEGGLLATVVGVILTALYGVALITVVRVAVLSSVVEGALLIATVVGDSSVVPTGKGGMNERMILLVRTCILYILYMHGSLLYEVYIGSYAFITDYLTHWCTVCV